MSRSWIYMRKYGLPTIMIGLLFYGAAYSADIIAGYKGFFAPKNTQEQAEITTLQSVESEFKSWAQLDVFDRKLVVEKLSATQGWTKMSERNMRLVQGIWTEDSNSDEGVELVFKTTNTSVALFNVDSVKAMYEYVSVNEEGKTLTMLVRTKEVGQ